jgi:hypothetical protein
VELRGVHGDPDRVCRGLSTYGIRAAGDVPVELPSQGISQCGDPDDVSEVLVHF